MNKSHHHILKRLLQQPLDLKVIATQPTYKEDKRTTWCYTIATMVRSNEGSICYESIIGSLTLHFQEADFTIDLVTSPSHGSNSNRCTKALHHVHRE